VAGAGLTDKARRSISPGATILPAQIDDVGTFGHAGGADAAPGVTDHAVGNEDVAGTVEIPVGIDDAGIGEQDRTAVLSA